MILPEGQKARGAHDGLEAGTLTQKIRARQPEKSQWHGLVLFLQPQHAIEDEVGLTQRRAAHELGDGIDAAIAGSPSDGLQGLRCLFLVCSGAKQRLYPSRRTPCGIGLHERLACRR